MRENAGFQIIASVPLEQKAEVVIGKMKTPSFEQYVCWYCNNGDDYFFGRYTDTYDKAVQNMIERLNEYFLGE